MGVKSFRQFLAEALLDVDKTDVDKIYAPLKKVMKELSAVWDKYFTQIVDPNEKAKFSGYASTEFYEILNKYKNAKPIKTFSSSELKSDLAKQAHAINPITINIWVVGPPQRSCNYSPLQSTIDIFLPASVADAMIHTLKMVPNSLISHLRNEVTELKHKTTIRHELTHWLDDSLHNLHLSKNIGRAHTLASLGQHADSKAFWKATIDHGESDTYLSPIEITPAVNQIAEYKRRVSKKKWDSLTWPDLMAVMPSLGASNSRLGAAWRKKMVARLARENLLGKNMLKNLG